MNLSIKTPRRRPTLTEANLENLHTVNLSGPEWNIQSGNQKEEYIPISLRMGTRNRWLTKNKANKTNKGTKGTKGTKGNGKSRRQRTRRRR
jgi:hypothetical protein